jgi:hypothetical protein
MSTHPAVEEQHAVRVIDDVAQTRLDTGQAGSGLLCRAYEITEVHAVDRDLLHLRFLPSLGGVRSP